MSVDLGNGNYVFLKKLMIGPMVSSIADNAFGENDVMQDSALEEVSFYRHRSFAEDEYDEHALRQTGKCSFCG